MSRKAKIVQVILVEDGLDLIYYTFEGVEIGSFKEGVRQKPTELHHDAVKPKGGVVTAPTPKQIRIKEKRQLEEDMKVENRLEHVKELASEQQ